MAHFAPAMPRTVSIELPDEALEKLELNSEIELRIRGKVRVLEAAYEPSEDEIEMGAPTDGEGSLVLQVLDVKVEDMENEFSKLDRAIEEDED